MTLAIAYAVQIPKAIKSLLPFFSKLKNISLLVKFRSKAFAILEVSVNSPDYYGEEMKTH